MAKMTSRRRAGSRKKKSKRKRFTLSEWAKIFAELNENGRAYDLPAPRVDSYVVASWNLRQFGSITKTKGDERSRDVEAFRFIASVISHFDLVAIQEVKDDLASLRELQRLLPDYQLIVSDSTGNYERLAYLYRTGRVRHTDLAAEIDIPMDAVQATLKQNWQAFRDALNAYGEAKARDPKFSGRVELPEPIGFERSPHCVSFEAGPVECPVSFLAFNTHIFYGPDKNVRTGEFKAFLEWLYDRWSRVSRIFAPHFVIFGDMNAEVAKGDASDTRVELLDFVEKSDAACRKKALGQARTKAERQAIKEQVTLFPFMKKTKFIDPPPIGSNLAKNERYDQIILMVRALESKIPGPGLWQAGVLDLPRLVKKALRGRRRGQAAYERDRIKQQISDHLPIWLRVELKSPL